MFQLRTSALQRYFGDQSLASLQRNYWIETYGPTFHVKFTQRGTELKVILNNGFLHYFCGSAKRRSKHASADHFRDHSSWAQVKAGNGCRSTVSDLQTERQRRTDLARGLRLWAGCKRLGRLSPANRAQERLAAAVWCGGTGRFRLVIEVRLRMYHKLNLL